MDTDSNETTLVNTGGAAKYGDRSKGDTLQTVIETYNHLNLVPGNNRLCPAE
jgi:hypothetical protein